MYNPEGEDTTEFIEFQNVGDRPLDLSGCYTDDGRWVFLSGTVLAPGAFFVLARSSAAFSARYPGVPCHAQFLDYGKNPKNSGETLWVENAAGQRILEVEYRTAPPWPITADGLGYSLVLVNPEEGPPYDASRWRASTYPGGSPGSNDPAPPFGPILINELLAHQDQDNPGDWIELYNPNNHAVNIGNWYLSDNPAVLTNYWIPANYIIPAHGYAVFTEYAHFGTNVLGQRGFALSEHGETVFLSSGDASRALTSYRTYVKFGASDNGVTFGRYVRSDGKEDFTALSRPAMGASNAEPRVEPVVINEIMYNPGPGGREHIELLNAGTTPRTLTDYGYPWRFDGAVEYTFPNGVTLQPGEHLLVVGIEPDEFRRRAGLTDPNLKIFGPFEGDLANEGETIKLYRLGVPEVNGFVPYVLVERIQYDDRPPWPTLADNGGASLERVDPRKYGNDPANWVAATVGGTPCASNNIAGLASVGFASLTGKTLESDTVVLVPVVLQPAVAATVKVAYAVVGGTAAPDADYTLPAGLLTFWPHETVKYIPLTIQDDALPEPDETVSIALTDITGARLGGNQLYTHTIVDTDGSSLPPPSIKPAGTRFMKMLTVAISPPASNIVVRYTTDGRVPDFDDPIYTSPLTLTSSTRLTARSFLGSYNAGGWTATLFVAEPPPPTPPPNKLWRWVSSSRDDAEEAANRNIVRTDRPLVPLATNGVLAAGFRFVDVQLAPDAVITNAYLQFTAALSDSEPVTVALYAQTSDDAAAFTNTAGNISSRATTAARVLWEVPPWTEGQKGAAQRTPDIQNLVREVISRPGWRPGNALAIIVKRESGTGSRLATAFDGSPADAAWLSVEIDTNHAETVTLTVSSPPLAGTDPPPGTHAFPFNTEIVCRVTNAPITLDENSRYECVGWLGTGNVPATGATADTGPIRLTANSSIAWLFATSYWINVTAASNGTVSGAGWWRAGTNAQLYASPNDGYHFVGWSGDVVSADNPLVLPVNGPLSLNAHFDINMYQISITGGPNGTVTPAGTVTLPHGSSTNVLIIPDDHYHVAGLEINGVAVPPATNYNFVNITNHCSLFATFAPDTHRLEVISPVGDGVPPVGVHWYEWNTEVQCFITNSPLIIGATQYVCVGWIGSGAAPALGPSTNTGVFRLTNDACLTWLWSTNFWLAVATNGAGEIVGGNRWVPANSNVLVEAKPAQHFIFAGWSGDTGGLSNNDFQLTITMDTPRNLIALFVPLLATNATPHWWLAEFYAETNDFDSLALSDSDGDGLAAWQEFLAGSDPTDPHSRFEFSRSGVSTAGFPVLIWPDVSDRVYSVYRAINLRGEWVELPVTGGFKFGESRTNIFEDTTAPNGPVYYRLKVRHAD